MLVDLGEIRKILPAGSGHVSLELRDDAGRLLMKALLDIEPLPPVGDTDERRLDGERASSSKPIAPNFESIIS
jgi:hypothetical protein